MDNIPSVAPTLTDSDYAALEAYTRSPVRLTLQKVAEEAIVTLYRQIEVTEDTGQIRQIVGRINGIRYMLNAPGIIVAGHQKSLAHAEALEKRRIRK
jgi:hypothetical protein